MVQCCLAAQVHREQVAAVRIQEQLLLDCHACPCVSSSVVTRKQHRTVWASSLIQVSPTMGCTDTLRSVWALGGISGGSASVQLLTTSQASPTCHAFLQLLNRVHDSTSASWRMPPACLGSIVASLCRHDCRCGAIARHALVGIMHPCLGWLCHSVAQGGASVGGCRC